MFFPVLIYLATVSSGVFAPGAFRPPVDTTPPTSGDTLSQIPRLTVRPQTMATGTHTRTVGLTALEGLPGYYVYVPPQCVGSTRSPLLLLLPGGGRTGAEEAPKFQKLADKYGMIVLFGNAVQPGRWDVIAGMGIETKMTLKEGQLVVSAFRERDVRNLDTALTRVLRTHAIDPDRIALLGFSDGGSYSLFLGLSNLDVFSRIAPLSAMVPFDGSGPPNPKTQFFLSGGVGEQGLVPRTLRIARKLRQRGHPVMTQLGLRGHADYVEDEEFIWAWLQQSWEDPGMTTRVPPEAAADPLLTEEHVQQMIAFWTRFQQQPDSIRTVQRMRYQMQVSLTVGSERTTVVMMNLPALAAASPSVAALLDSVGLTAAQAMAYRTAIIRTGIARLARMAIEGTPQDSTKAPVPFAPVAPSSVLGQNLEFWKTHGALFTELEKLKMWTTQ